MFFKNLNGNQFYFKPLFINIMFGFNKEYFLVKSLV